MVMYRNGHAEETYFTFSFSPIPADEGGIGGLFCACTEDTQKVLGERRLATLRHLASATAQARTEREAGVITAETLAKHDSDIAFALMYLLTRDGDRAELAAGTGECDNVPWAPKIIEFQTDVTSTDFIPWPLGRAMEEGKQVLRMESFKQSLPGGRWPEPSTTVAVVPLAKAGRRCMSSISAS